MIYDNVDDASLLDGYLPALVSGSVLITSRDPAAQHDLAKNGCKVSSFSDNDGREFLLSLLPGFDSTDQGEFENAMDLTSQLGGLPLGLKQMAGFLRESGCSISELSDMVRDVEQDEKVFADVSGFAQLGYSNTLSTLWTISLSRLDKETLNLLTFLSFLDPDGISDHIVKSLQTSRCDFPHLFPSGLNAVRYQQILIMCLQ